MSYFFDYKVYTQYSIMDYYSYYNNFLPKFFIFKHNGKNVSFINFILYKIDYIFSKISNFFTNWVLSTNHRRIALMYFIFTIISGFTGLILATVIRIELAYPGQSILFSNAEKYLTIISLHGIIMVFFMIIPIIFGAFGNFLLPTQLGIRDVAFPRLNSFMFWVTPSGFVMLLHILLFDKSYNLTYWLNYSELRFQLRRRFYITQDEFANFKDLSDNSLLSIRLKNNNIDFYSTKNKILKDFNNEFDNSIFKTVNSLFYFNFNDIIFLLYFYYISLTYSITLIILDLTNLSNFKLQNNYFFFIYIDLNFFFLYIFFFIESFCNILLSNLNFFLFLINSLIYELVYFFNYIDKIALFYAIFDFIYSSNNSLLVNNRLFFIKDSNFVYFDNFNISFLDLYNHIFYYNFYINKIDNDFYLKILDNKNISNTFTNYFLNHIDLEVLNLYMNNYIFNDNSFLNHDNFFYFMNNDSLMCYIDYIDSQYSNSYYLSTILFLLYLDNLMGLFLFYYPFNAYISFENLFIFIYNYINNIMYIKIFSIECFFILFDLNMFSILQPCINTIIFLLFDINYIFINFDIKININLMSYFVEFFYYKLITDMYIHIYQLLINFDFLSYLFLIDFRFILNNIMFEFLYNIILLDRGVNELIINHNNLLIDLDLIINDYLYIFMLDIFFIDLYLLLIRLDFYFNTNLFNLFNLFFIDYFFYLTVIDISVNNYILSLIEIFFFDYIVFFTQIDIYLYYILYSFFFNLFFNYYSIYISYYYFIIIFDKYINNSILNYFYFITFDYFFFLTIIDITLISYIFYILESISIDFKILLFLVDFILNKLVIFDLFYSHIINNFIYSVLALLSNIDEDFNLILCFLYFKYLPNFTIIPHINNIKQKSWQKIDVRAVLDEIDEICSCYIVTSGLQKKNYNIKVDLSNSMLYPERTLDNIINNISSNDILNFNNIVSLKNIRSYVDIYVKLLLNLDYFLDWRELRLERDIWRSVDDLSLARRHWNLRKKYFANFYEPETLISKVSIWLPNHLIPGWAFVTPYSSRLRYTALGKVDIALIVVFAASLGSVFSSVNYVITYRYIGSPIFKNRRELRSFFIDALLDASRMMILANPALLIGIILLLSDRHFGTSVFDFSGGGDTILFQHLFWFFGHPEVYIIIIPCFGFMNSLLPYYLKKRLSGRLSLQFSMYTIAFMGFAVWGHHMYMVGLANSVRTLYSTMTVMISVPASTKVLHWCVTIINSTITSDVGFLFLLSFMYFFVLGGLSGMFLAHIGFDVIFHDTFYVIGHFHVMLAGAAMSCIFAAFYFYFPSIFGVKYSRFFAYLHFVFYLSGQLLTLIPMFWLGYAGMPRRIMDYPSVFSGWHSIISSGHILTFMSLVFFLIMIFDSIYESRAPISKNRGVSRLNNRFSLYVYESRKLQFNKNKSLLLQNSYLFNNKLSYNNLSKLELENFEYIFLNK